MDQRSGSGSGPYGQRFVLRGRLNISPLAEVFSATDTQTGRDVIIKRAVVSHGDSIAREHAVLSLLGAPLGGAVPELLGHGVLEPVAWFAMSRVEGCNLREFQQKLRRPGAVMEASAIPSVLRLEHLETVLTLAGDLAKLLAKIHALGIVHGDLSPENILIRPDGQLVLIDFEVACSARGGLGGGFLARVTPGYAAPEALRGEALDCRADLYSWACIVRELLVDKPVFFGATASALACQHLDATPAPAASVLHGVPGWLDALLLQALAKDPRRRRTPACALLWRLGQRASHLPARKSVVETRPPLNQPSFVGCHAELRQIEARLEVVPTANGGSIVVLGAPGTGKSRLLGEVARRARARGFRVLYGLGAPTTQSPDPMHSRGPLLPRLMVEHRLNPRPPATPSAEQQLDLAVLHSLLPSDIELEASRADDDGLPPEALQRRAFRAVTRLLCEGAAPRPLLVLIDDLHRVDEFTASLLASPEAGVLANAPVLVVAAAVPLDEATSPPLARVIAGALDRIELNGLDRSGTLQLVSESLDADDCVELAGHLHEQCDGNPRRVTQVLEQAVEHRLLVFDAERGWCLPEPGTFDALCRLTREDSAAKRLLALAPALQRLAALAAVIGPRFERESLEELAADASLDVDALLSELSQRGLLSPNAGGYEFPDENTRVSCEQLLPPVERHELNARLAERSMSQFGDDPAMAGVIGGHWLNAGRTELALPWLIRSAERLEKSLEPFAAIATLRRGLDAMRALSPHADWAGPTLEVAERLLELYTRTAQHGPLRSLAEELVARVSDAPLRYRALVELARSLRVTGDYSAATLHLDRAERLLRKFRKTGQRGQQLWLDLQEQRIWLLYMLRDAQGIGPVLQRMAPIVRSHGSAKQLAAYYMWSANELVLRNGYRFSQTAVAEERRAVRLLEHANALPELAMTEFDLAFMLILGDISHCAEALPHLERARSLAERLSDPVLAARAATYLAIAERRRGNVGSCYAWARAALEEARLSGIRGYIGAAQACLGWAEWRRDDVRAALEHFAEAQKMWWHRRQSPLERSRDEFPFQWLAHLPLLALHSSRDEFDAARAAVAELLAESQQRLPDPLHQGLSELARDWTLLGVTELERRAAELVRRSAQLGYV
jgi:eukaryotic-like serine/threonine-protein kinase